MLGSLKPLLPNFITMAQAHMEQNMMLYQENIAEGVVARYKTIGVDYSTILAVHGRVTDELPVES